MRKEWERRHPADLFEGDFVERFSAHLCEYYTERQKLHFVICPAREYFIDSMSYLEIFHIMHKFFRYHVYHN